MAPRPADGGGFTVDAQSLRGFAHTADGVGQRVESLVGKAQAALALGVPGGLDIGAAIARARQSWGNRLQQLASEASRISANLTSNAASYDENESATHDSFVRVLRGGASAL